LSAGLSAFSLDSLPVGTNTIAALFAAQGNFLGSSNSLAQVVNSAVTLSQTNVILSILNNGDGTYTLNLLGTPQAVYYVAATSDVTQPMSAWTNLIGSTNTAPANGQWSFAVSNAAPAYYRSIAVNPAP